MAALLSPQRLLAKARTELTLIGKQLSEIPEDAPPVAEVVPAEACAPAQAAALLHAQQGALLGALPGLIARAHNSATLVSAITHGYRCAHPDCLAEIDLHEKYVRLLRTPGEAPQRFHIECAQIILDADLATILADGAP